MLRRAASTKNTQINRPHKFLILRAYAGGGGHGHDDGHGHGHHAPPLYKPRNEWDTPNDARYWHDMLKTVKEFNKELAAEEHHSSFYVANHHVAKPGVYDELRASSELQKKLKEPKKQPQHKH